MVYGPVSSDTNQDSFGASKPVIERLANATASYACEHFAADPCVAIAGVAMHNMRAGSLSVGVVRARRS